MTTIATTVRTEFETPGVAQASSLVERFAKGLRVVDRESKRAKFSVTSFAKSAANLGKVALGVGAGIAAAAAGLFVLVKRSIETADAIGKAADKIGVGVEALQELRFAAEQSGASAAALDTSLQRFSRRLGEAAQGEGVLAKVVEQNNIALTKQDGTARSVTDILGDYADVVANAANEQEQLRLTVKAFDSEGAVLVNLLRQGKEGVQGLQNQARDLGIVLDNSLVRTAEKANDQLNIMTRVLGASLNRVLISFAPLVIKLGNAFAESAPKFQQFLDKAFTFFNLTQFVSDKGLEKRASEIISQLQKIQDKAKELGYAPGKELTPQIKALDKQAVPLLDELDRIRAQQAKNQALDVTITKQQQLIENSTKLAGLEKEINSFTEKASQLGLSQVQLIRQEEQALLTKVNALTLTKEKQEELSGAIKRSADAQVEFTKAQEAANKPVAQYLKQLEDGETLLQNAIVNGANSATDALLGFADGTKSAGEAFRNFATSILRDIARIAIQKAIVGPIVDTLFGGLGSSGGTSAGTGIFSGAPVATIAEGGAVRRFASGGMNLRDSVPALLEPGEFVLRKDAAKNIGLSNLQRMNATGSSGGQAPQIHIHNNGTPQEQDPGKAPQYDVEKGILDIWIRDFENNGQTRKAIKGLR